MTYSADQIADRYGVSEKTVHHWRETGQLKMFNVGRDPGKARGRWRATEEALREFENTRSNSPPEQPRRRRKRQPADVIEFYK